LTTQLVPHASSPVAQVAEHLLCEQSSPPVQAVPHMPQFVPSEVRFKQLVPQAVRPPAH